MEIGSFLELQLPKGREYYGQSKNVARLNSGRAAIYHASRVLGCDTVWVPVYQCETVRDFLLKKGVTVKYYHIDPEFNPTDISANDDEAILLVNYYGVMSHSRMASLAAGYKNVIIDNSQAFFCKPVEGAMNVYSARKFIGVPDGAYVLGEGAERFCEEYEKCHSSDTAAFLLMRVEYGCEGKTYEARSINENRIDSEDIMQMSALTRYILDGTDCEEIKRKRRENFRLAHALFGDVNRIDPTRYLDGDCVPMVYPLVVEDDSLLHRLLEHKHFQGHWWSYILEENDGDLFECYLSRYIIPITIDQRYGKAELEFLRGLI
ncbi:MAG: hypothetical protein IKL44_02735 [Clostridia bacterium]|nr:hypothetical protein [Clostridia bacterium]